jgi:hypothetical protein
MVKSGHMINYVVIHAIWVIAVGEAYAVNFMLNSYTGLCFFWYVRPSQIGSVLWTGMGLIAILARLIDKTFRKALNSLFRIERLTKPKIHNGLLSYDFANSVTDKSSITHALFESLHMKVSSRQFILDSLISLSFNLAKNSIIPSEGAEESHQGSNLGRSEEVYSIEADIIKQVLQTEQLDDFFNECED